MVKLKKVTREFFVGNGSVKALNNVSMEIKRSDFIAIMGPSGSGKSTLLHLLGGVDKPTVGEIWIGDKCISQMSDNEVTLFRRTQIGFVFQSFNLLPTLTVTENITLPLRIAGLKIDKYRERVNELIRLTGLEGREQHKPRQLSGGQQQRVAIARAFVTEPDIILLDEPTGNLDSKTGDNILKIISDAHRLLKKTVVLVTHSVFAAGFAQKVLFLKDGKYVQSLERENGNCFSAKEINDIILSL